jgi:hypothetical protein
MSANNHVSSLVPLAPTKRVHTSPVHSSIRGFLAQQELADKHLVKLESRPPAAPGVPTWEETPRPMAHSGLASDLPHLGAPTPGMRTQYSQPLPYRDAHV